MKKVWDFIARDLWIVLLDIFAVNLAYFMGLLFRFSVNIDGETAAVYITYWAKFTGFYTVLALVVFALFRLYGGMWRYAGINDMNRIIAANAVTIPIQVIGTLVVGFRMPLTYYIIGAILQFLAISLIRFGYRILLVEKKKIANKKNSAGPALVIGGGETGRKAVLHLEENTAYWPAYVVDAKSAGKTLNGVPVVADLDKALSEVKAVFIADPRLDAEQRAAIKQKSEELGVELQDYTGYLSNLGGRVPLTALLELAEGKVKINIDGEEKEFASGLEALRAINGRYDITKVTNLQVELRKPIAASYIGYDTWAKQHKEETGEDVSFF